MSNFMCEKCGAIISENQDGLYVTSCEHYPLEEFNSEPTTNDMLAMWDNREKS